MRGLAIVLGGLVFSQPAFAQEQKLTGVEIEMALSDHTLQGSDENSNVWRQIFQKAGATYYAVNGGQSQGVWQVRGDQYCSQWPPNESWTCYDLLRDGENFIFVSGSGQRTTGKLLN